MIDSLSLLLITGVFIVAMMKRSEMSLWLLLVTGFGAVVSIGNSSPDAAITFFCGANLILMLASFASWRRTRLNLPFFIGILACVDVVVGFIHFLHLLNVGTASYAIGLVTGVIGYIQLLLVCIMKDTKGVMNDILNDFGDQLYRILRVGSTHHHGGNNK